jgi:hypothetical protein
MILYACNRFPFARDQGFAHRRLVGPPSTVKCSSNLHAISIARFAKLARSLARATILD